MRNTRCLSKQPGGVRSGGSEIFLLKFKSSVIWFGYFLQGELVDFCFTKWRMIGRIVAELQKLSRVNFWSTSYWPALACLELSILVIKLLTHCVVPSREHTECPVSACSCKCMQLDATGSLTSAQLDWETLSLLDHLHQCLNINWGCESRPLWCLKQLWISIRFMLL